MITEKIKNEALEKKWREEFEKIDLPLSLKKNFQGTYKDIETLRCWVSYFTARKAAQVEIEELKEKELSFCYDLQLFVHDLLMEKGEYWTFQCIRKKAYTHSKDKKWGDDSYIDEKFKNLDSLLDKLKDRDKEIEGLKSTLNGFKGVGGDLSREIQKRDEEIESLKTENKELRCDNAISERDELIKEFIDTFDLFDEVPLPFKIVNKMESVVKKSRKMVGEG